MTATVGHHARTIAGEREHNLRWHTPAIGVRVEATAEQTLESG